MVLAFMIIQFVVDMLWTVLFDWLSNI